MRVRGAAGGQPSRRERAAADGPGARAAADGPGGRMRRPIKQYFKTLKVRSSYSVVGALGVLGVVDEN